MQGIHINYVFGFPFTSALDGECKSISSLTGRGSGGWQHSTYPSQINNSNLDGPFTNQDLPLKSLCLHKCMESFLQEFAPWFATRRSQLPSFESFSSKDRGYDSLPRF